MVYRVAAAALVDEVALVEAQAAAAKVLQALASHTAWSPIAWLMPSAEYSHCRRSACALRLM